MNQRKEPDPENAQKDFEDFVRQRFSGSFPNFSSAVSPPPRRPSPPEEEPTGWDWDFPYKPKDVKHFLDRSIMRQDEAKRTLAIAICDHYNQVKSVYNGSDAGTEEYTKQNILLLGPSGVGKTYLIRKIAELIGVPFVKADATKFSETGYVGANVEDLVRELVSQARGDIRKAECGLIYLDEADKLATRQRSSTGRDVNGRGVQFGLLRLMEETEIDLRSGHDLQSQLQTIMDFQRGKLGRGKVSTKHILFIVSGAFTGLEDIVQRRLGRSALGFQTDHSRVAHVTGPLVDHATSEDFVNFGFEPEFIGRLPVRVACHPLSKDDLLSIMLHSEGSILRQYQKSFRAYDITLRFTPEALDRIATLAFEERTGARGLMTVCEKVLRPYKFELPSTLIRELEVTPELVADPEGFLQRMLDKHSKSQLN